MEERQAYWKGSLIRIVKITLSCGHEKEVDLPDDADEREHKLSWLKSFGMCEDCFYDWNWGQGRR